MAYIYHGTRNLINIAGRSVQTFPSGLVRVERTYACRRGDEARYRADLKAGSILPNDIGEPAIDGLYIFPDTQEQTREDGFTDFRVSAYGRTNTTGRTSRSLEVKTVSIPAFIVWPTPSTRSSLTFLTAQVGVDAVNLNIVVPTSTEIDEIEISKFPVTFSVIATNFDSLVSNLRSIGFADKSITISNIANVIKLTPVLSAFSRENYGAFDELSATITGNLSTQGNFATITIQ